MGSDMWGMLVVIGPLLLAAVVAWAVINNRRSRADNQRTEAATRELYERTDREDKTAAERGDV